MVPISFGQLSSGSATPSSSESGHPYSSAEPGIFGHLSFLLKTPSSSLSLFPAAKYIPA